MNLPSQMLDMIKQFEGCRLSVYNDASSTPNSTIGYGHLITPTENFTTITQEQADELLMQDAIKAIKAVTRLVTIPLNENQLCALGDFVFNLGAGTFQASNLRKVINRQEFSQVPNQFLRWVFAGTIKLPGLLRRRHAEAQLFMS